VLEGIASMWATSSLLMKTGLDSKNILYFHVLQPNQYHQTGRRFGEAEQKIAFGGSSAYREGVIKGYPILLSKTPLLRAANENFFDATRIFDQTPEAVYSDNCCHYNQAGNQLFAEYIAKSIVDVLQSSPDLLPHPGGKLPAKVRRAEITFSSKHKATVQMQLDLQRWLRQSSQTAGED
jgi:hypothetical protein